MNAWFKAAHSGHGVFYSIKASGQAVTPVVWGGLLTHEDVVGRFVVVSILTDGTEQLTTKRGRVQRFTKQHAVEFAKKLGISVQKAADAGDPFCYSDQSRACSTRSVPLTQLGGKEKILPITDVVVRAFDAKEAGRYPNPGSWYAPLLVLREAKTLRLITLDNAVPAISDPLALGRYLDNWRKAEFEIPDYEIEALLTDAQVDKLIDDVTGPGLGVIIDPILSEDGEIELVRGHPVYSLAVIEQRSAHK